MVITGTRCCQKCKAELQLPEAGKSVTLELQLQDWEKGIHLGQRLLLSLECRIMILSSVSVLSLFVIPKSTPKFCLKHIDA